MNVSICSRHGVEIMDVVVKVKWIFADVFIPEGNGWIQITVSKVWLSFKLLGTGAIKHLSKPAYL